MQKTKFVEIKPYDRLPTEKGEYIAVIDPETNFAGFFSFDPEDSADVNWWIETPEYWLKEVPDYEDEMKEMLEFIYGYGEKVEWSKVRPQLEQLLTKQKTESCEK